MRARLGVAASTWKMGSFSPVASTGGDEAPGGTGSPQGDPRVGAESTEMIQIYVSSDGMRSGMPYKEVVAKVSSREVLNKKLNATLWGTLLSNRWLQKGKTRLSRG